MHKFVNHSGWQFVKGEIHVNGMENFWSILKRGYKGIYHRMSPKHLQRYPVPSGSATNEGSHLFDHEMGHRAERHREQPGKRRRGGGAAAGHNPRTARSSPTTPGGRDGTVQTVRESYASPSARLLFAFTTLTACRSGEARLSRWSEVDLEARVWTVPADRMKAKREHLVSLATKAADVLTEARQLVDG